MRKIGRPYLIILLTLLLGGVAPLSNSHGLLLAQADDLSTTVKESLESDDVLAGFDIVPLVVDGVVTLYGAVDTQEQLDRLSRLVSEIPGVKSTVNKALALELVKEESTLAEEVVENNDDGIKEEDLGQATEVPTSTDIASAEILSPDVTQELPASEIPEGVPEFHVAKPGESIGDISEQYGMAPYLIRQLNGMGASQQPVAFQKIILGGSGSNSDFGINDENSDTVVLEVLNGSDPEIEVIEEEVQQESMPVIVQVDREETETVAEPEIKPEEMVIVPESPKEEKKSEDTRPSRTDDQENTRTVSRLGEAETIIRNGWVFHRVSRGEIDIQIADFYNVAISDLRKKNGLRPGGSLRRGSLIRIKKASE